MYWILPPWSVNQELVFTDDPSHFFIAVARPEDKGGPDFIRPQKYFSEASATWEQLIGTAPGMIVIRNYEGELTEVTREEFDATCAESSE